MTVDAAPKRWDVPPVIALGALVVTAAALFPLAHRTPLYPDGLPAFTPDGGALVAEHRRDLARPRPEATAEALAAWNALTVAQARAAAPAARAQAQRHFAQTLFDATDGAPERALAIRAIAAIERAHPSRRTERHFLAALRELTE